MSTTIDQKVVEMRFDNKQFESGVSTTMSTLDKFKQKLNLTGASKGLEEIDSTARKMNFSGLSNAVETVSAKFSALQVMGVTALANITNSAVNAGKRMMSALTIDPIKSGFQEYETQINAVQTILANTESKGSTLQDVNRALDELNTYADKTIYNFTEMTRNIGTFTAAGVELDTAVSAIQGIANLAAVSGSTSQQASTAMYQLSQALSSGTVKLMDWNSVVNAGMGGQVFQDALKQTARVHGIAIDKMIKEEGSFRETLSKGWLTADILTETLNQFTMAAEEGTEEWENYKKSLMDTGYSEEQAVSILKLANTATDAATKVKTFTQLWDTLKEAAQSGWTQSWEIMIGDFEEAKGFLTDISERVGKMIGDSADSRNKMLSEGLSSGWKQLLNAGIADEEGYKESIKSVAKEHGVAIDDMIKSEKELDETLTDGEAFQKVLKKGLKEGTISSDMMAESVHKMAEKMSSMSAEELKAAGYTADHVKQIKDLSAGLKDGSISMDDFVKKMTRASGRENIIQALWNSFDGLMEIITPIKEAFREIFPPMTGDQLYNLTVKIKELTENFKVSEETAKKIKSTFKGLFSILDIGLDAIKAIGKGAITLIKSFSGAGGKILDLTASMGDGITSFRDYIKENNLFGIAVEKATSFLTKIISKIKEFGSALRAEMDSSKFKGFLSFFESLWNIIKRVGSAVTKAFTSIGKGVSGAFGEHGVFDVINSGIFSGILVGIYKFVKNFSKSFDGVHGVLENVKGILDDVRGCFQAYQDKLKAGILLKIASAIGILTAAIFVLSTIDPESLGNSLTAITVMFAELLGSLAIFEKMAPALKGTAKSISLMIGMSVAIAILAGALKRISSIDTAGLIKGLVGIAGMAGILVAAAKIMNSSDKAITKFAGQMVLMSVAIGALSLVAKYLSSMSWEELAKGGAGILGITVILVAAAKIMDSNDKAITKFAGQMIGLSVAIGALSLVAKFLSSMSWTELAKGGAGILGITVILVAAAKIMDSGNKAITKFAGQMIFMAAALAILAPVLKSLSSMSWEEIGKGLVVMGGALAELAIGLKLMSGSVSGSAALLIAATALAIIVPVMKSLGNMSWESIGKGLITLAGAFAVIGIAGLLLKPLIPTLLGLSAAFALFGISTALIGAGLLAISAGFTALATAGAAGATAIVAALAVIIVGILDLIPAIARTIGVGIVEICKVIGDCAPQIAESALKLIAEVMNALATYTPQIVDSLMIFLIGVINSLATYLPDLIQAAANLVSALFTGIFESLKSLDVGNLLKGIIATGLTTALIYALSGIASLIPGAMVGVLGVGAVIAELSLVLAAIGKLSEIPGLENLVSEGGNFLEKIGTAIGQFVGGLAGGIAQGFTSSLPQIGTDLSSFMTNIQTFVEGAKNIDKSVLTGVGSLAGAILAITAAEVVNGIASFLTGGSSLSDFAEQLVPFGEAMKAYSDTIVGIDPEAVTASANAAKTLSELASNLPNSGGVVGFFAGENDLSDFAEQLVPFGEAMKEYSDSISGLNPAAVIASACAAKSLSELANNLPNSGGLAGFFAGENNLISFAVQLVPFGKAMKSYSDSIAGLNPDSVVSSANAAKSLSELANNLPNSGGLAGFFAGENDLASFGAQLILFGEAMKGYAESIIGIDNEAVVSSANAAKSLSELANNLPNSGGLVSLFAGDNSLIGFGLQLVPFGKAMKSYSNSIAGLNPEAVTASANAAKSLSELANNLPNSGGLISAFTGDNTLGEFANQLEPFGKGMKAYAASVAGIDPESVTASANAAKSISELASNLPNSGGFISAFTGENNLGEFAAKLEPLGKGMKAYADSVSGIDSESVIASVNAAKALCELSNNLPTSGGLMSIFTEETDIASIVSKVSKLVPFGKSMKQYSDVIAGIDSTAITHSADAAKALVDVINNISGVSGFFGDSGITSMTSKLIPLGKGLKGYSDSVAGINAGAISSSATAAGKLVSFINSTAGMNASGVGSFVSAINSLGKAQVSKFVEVFKNVPSQMSKIGSDIMDSLTNSIRSKSNVMSSAATSVITAFSSGMSSQKSKVINVISTLLDSIAKSISSKSTAFNNSGVMIMTNLSNGITSQIGAVRIAMSTAILSSITSIQSHYGSFYSAGGYLADGFANGISANSYKAAAQARAMALTAKKAAEEALGIESPSKVFYAVGEYTVQGFVNALTDHESEVYSIGYDMAEYARKGLSDAISQIQNVANSDTDYQPTIKPVLDLSDVESGAAAISKLFSGNESVGVSANVDSISSTMNQKNQNGSNKEVVSAIDGLRKDIKNIKSVTYSVNNVTYDDGSNVSKAVTDLVRAARIERRI